MKHGVHDHASLIAALGGAPAIVQSDAIDVAQVTVRAWASRNRIPPEYWSAVIALASDIDGITPEWLLATFPNRLRANGPVANDTVSEVAQ